MRRSRRRSAALAATLLVIGQILTAAPAALAATPVPLNILTVNDFHGRIDTNAVKFAGTIEGLRAGDGASGANTLIVGAGDFIGASLFDSAIAQDQPTIDVFNALDMDASAVGNHEFDQGFADLTDRVIDGGANAQWDYLGANVYQKGTTTPALPEYGIYQVAGIDIGVIGVVTQETPSLVAPAGVATLDFGDPVAAINRVADQLTDGNTANGEADVLIATLHEGAPVGGAQSVFAGQVAASPVFAHIVNDTTAKVAAIVNGHTHVPYAWQAPVPGDPTKTRPIIQTGNYGSNVGQIVLNVDPDTNTIVSNTATVVPRVATADTTLISTYPRVAEVNTIVLAALAAGQLAGDTQVGTLTADITTAVTPSTPNNSVCAVTSALRDDRASESTIGDLVANSLLDTLSAADRGGAEIGVVNPGGLRAELCYLATAGAADATGRILYREANAVLPFLNNLWTSDMTGAQFKTALEQQWQRDAAGNVPSRSYLQLGLSDNVTYTFDPNLPEGSRVTSIRVDGAPIDLTKTYRIGGFSFLLQGGDNFRVFAQGTNVKDSGLIDRDAWVAYLGEHPGIAPDFARQAVAVVGAPAAVDAGGALSFDVSKLDLTSLGSPANTTLTAVLQWAGSGPAPAPIPLGSSAVTAGAGHVGAVLPAKIKAGAWEIVLTAAPSGTTAIVPLTVNATSSVALAASAPSQVFGSSKRILLTATVTTSNETAGGSVEFKEGDTVLATVPVANGVATYRRPASTPAGPHSIVARYTGDGSAPASVSAPVDVTVLKARSSTAMAAIGLWWFFPNTPPTLVGAVTLETGRTARGTVQIRDNGALIGTATVRSGGFLFQVPRSTWTRGTHAYVATFVPSDPANIDGSTSRTITVRR